MSRRDVIVWKYPPTAWWPALPGKSESASKNARMCPDCNRVTLDPRQRNVFVNAGDRINFIVDPNVDYFFDSTGITATITTVPDSASSLALLSISLVAMFAAKFLLRPWLT